MESPAEELPSSYEAHYLASLQSPGRSHFPSATKVTPNDDSDYDPLPFEDRRSSTDNFILDSKNPRLFPENIDFDRDKITHLFQRNTGNERTEEDIRRQCHFYQPLRVSQYCQHQNVRLSTASPFDSKRQKKKARARMKQMYTITLVLAS